MDRTDIGGEWADQVGIRDGVGRSRGRGHPANRCRATAGSRPCPGCGRAADVDAGHIVAELYERFGEAPTTTPTFHADFPVQPRRSPGPTERSTGCRSGGPRRVGGRTGHRLHRAHRPAGRAAPPSPNSPSLAAGGDPDAMESTRTSSPPRVRDASDGRDGTGRTASSCSITGRSDPGRRFLSR